MSDGMSAPQRKNAAWATGRSTPARSTNPAITATDPSAPPGPCELLPPPRTYASGSPPPRPSTRAARRRGPQRRAPSSYCHRRRRGRRRSRERELPPEELETIGDRDRIRAEGAVAAVVLAPRLRLARLLVHLPRSRTRDNLVEVAVLEQQPPHSRPAHEPTRLPAVDRPAIRVPIREHLRQHVGGPARDPCADRGEDDRLESRLLRRENCALQAASAVAAEAEAVRTARLELVERPSLLAHGVPDGRLVRLHLAHERDARGGNEYGRSGPPPAPRPR